MSADGTPAETAGLSPGTLVHVGEKLVDKVKITVIDYDSENFYEKEVATVEECFRFRETSTVTWINIDGIHDASVIEKLGTHFGIHPLILEDIMNTSQRPKLEDMGDSIYLVLKMIEFVPECPDVSIEQMSVVFGKNFVLSFQERPGDTFDPVRETDPEGEGADSEDGARLPGLRPPRLGRRRLLRRPRAAGRAGGGPRGRADLEPRAERR